MLIPVLGRLHGNSESRNLKVGHAGIHVGVGVWGRGRGPLQTFRIYTYSKNSVQYIIILIRELYERTADRTPTRHVPAHLKRYDDAGDTGARATPITVSTTVLCVGSL